MTTPTTQEPEQPLSLVDHLRTTLYNLKAQHSRVQGAIEGYRSMANPDDDYRDLLTTCERTAEQLEQQITAQEQSIAILSVLDSPAFNRLSKTRVLKAVPPFPATPPDRACWVHLQGPTRKEPIMGYGGTTIAALLKAHTALKPQEAAALPEKELQANDE